ncbi:chromate transporter [uncultured Acinetobacter sp.]|uniref:chromate transporter n=1 Tax=uncultured Acinetobacter sp. TaxID=165433 RepID=UPI00258F7945|nr:chromate transporter [uncultured Acinetobacter sp.]
MKVHAMPIASEQTSTPSCKVLFIGFMKLGLMGFGGVLPLAHRMIVEDQKWLDEAQFTNLLGVCQLLPGGNIINMSVAIGMQFQGVKGAFSSILGLISAPTLIVLGLYQIYEHFQHLSTVRHMIQGLAAAAAGLLFATGLKMLRPIMKSYLTALTIVLTFIFMLIVKIPLALTLLILLVINFVILGARKA